MKKLIAGCLILVTLLSLTACQFDINLKGTITPTEGDPQNTTEFEENREDVSQQPETNGSESNESPALSENGQTADITEAEATESITTEPEATQKPTEKPTEPAVTQKPTEKPTEPAVTQKPTEKPTEPAVTQKPTEKPTEPAVTQKPTEKPTQKPTEPPATEPPMTEAPKPVLPDYYPGDFAEQFLTLINQERANAGVGNLSMSNTISRLAYVRAQEISRVWSHTRPNGESWTTAFNEYGVSWGNGIAENLAYISYKDAADVVASWMSSPGHRNNMLNGSYDEIGIGIFYSAGNYYICTLYRA